MSFYGQESYTEKMGNGNYTIAQVGCFLTAFSNILQEFGKTLVPPALNTFFTEHNIYLPDAADGSGVKDDLAWGSITAYDPTITVAATGSGSWPNSNLAIIEFVYDYNGTQVTHFCAVASVANKTIIDSWDGNIKPPGVYGAPVRWATYEKNSPQVVPVANPKAVVTTTDYGNYHVVKPIPGYIDANEAANGKDSNSTVPVGSYSIFNKTANGMINVTAKSGVAGWWINPNTNVLATPAPSSNNVYSVVTPLKGYITATDAAKRENSNSTVPVGNYAIYNRDEGMINITRKAAEPGWWINPNDTIAGHGAGEATPTNTTPPSPPITSMSFTLDTTDAGMYRANTTTTITDQANPNNPPLTLKSGTLVKVAGSFVGTNTLPYFLPQFSLNAGNWYGIPTPALTLLQVPYISKKLTVYGHVLKALATVVGLFNRKEPSNAPETT